MSAETLKRVTTHYFVST